MSKKIIYRSYFKSPIGLLSVTANEAAITKLSFVNQKRGKEKKNEVIKDCLKQLSEYFKRERYDFNIMLEQKGTEFQQKVWNELQKIPYGMTIHYLDIAKKIKNRTVSRAVGNASGQNQIPIIIPCHRLIGISGDLVGYSGGLEKKKWLLEFENETVEPKLFTFKNIEKKPRKRHKKIIA